MSAASAPATEIYSPGLEGVIAGETAVSTVEGGLRYRGYPVTELCQYCNFDEVAFLMLYGELPTPKQLTDFQSRVSAARKLPECLRPLLAALPRNVSPMDAIRTSISVLAHFDPDVNDSSPEANLRKAERLYAQIPLAVADQFHLSKGKAPVDPRTDLGAAAHFMYLVRGKEATPEEVRAFFRGVSALYEHIRQQGKEHEDE